MNRKQVPTIHPRYQLLIFNFSFHNYKKWILVVYLSASLDAGSQNSLGQLSGVVSYALSLGLRAWLCCPVCVGPWLIASVPRKWGMDVCHYNADIKEVEAGEPEIQGPHQLCGELRTARDNQLSLLQTL